jgi:hypothetical protein
MILNKAHSKSILSKEVFKEIKIFFEDSLYSMKIRPSLFYSWGYGYKESHFF